MQPLKFRHHQIWIQVLLLISTILFSHNGFELAFTETLTFSIGSKQHLHQPWNLARAYLSHWMHFLSLTKASCFLPERPIRPGSFFFPCNLWNVGRSEEPIKYKAEPDGHMAIWAGCSGLDTHQSSCGPVISCVGVGTVWSMPPDNIRTLLMKIK